MFSKTCQYALQSVLYIHLHSIDGVAVKIKDIAETQNIPLHFLGKTLQILVRHKILISVKGPNGGFILTKAGNELKLLEVVKAIDGLGIFERCGIGLKTCSDEQPCPIHYEYQIVKNKIKDILTNKSVAELCEDVETGQSIVSFHSSENQ